MRLVELLDFLEPPVGISWTLTPSAALEALKAKGLKASFSYADLSAAEHASSFTVAKMMDTDMLADVKASLEDALATGKPFKEWAGGIIPLLQAKGWWGREPMVDPLTGQTVVAQLGSPGRLQAIFRTNIQSAYAVGEWEQIKAQADVAPFLMYDAVDDYRTRPEHAALDGKIHPVDDPFWKHYHPPNGWNCRCSVIQLSQDELDELGLSVSPPARLKTYQWTNPRTGKVEDIAQGTDPGFDFNPGEARLQHLQQLAAEKAASMPPDAAKAVLEGIQATQRQVTNLTKLAVADALKGGGNLLSASKAAERAAVHQISKALQEKTPYLSTAIQAIQKTKAAKSMTATELLAAAKEKAVKAEASAFLGEYKKAGLAGKKPNAKAQAAFDALPEEAQQALTDQINAQLADLKAQAAAQAELLDIADGKQGAVAKKVLAEMDQAGKPSVDVLAAVKAQTSAINAANNAASAVSLYKKALLNGKVPSPLQKAAFESLSAEKQAKLLADVEKAKAKAAPPPPPSAEPPVAAAKPAQPNAHDTPLNPEALTQTGPQGGSNPGGVFTDTDTGVRWYVKYPDNLEAMRNEVLANRLYKLAGVESPDVRLIQFRGKPAIASRIVDGLQVDRAALEAGRVAGVQEHFAVDAWLANWDVIGPDFANTKLTSLGTGLRIDPGGALRFRAQGGMKGAAFGDEVLDLESMRNSGTNWHAASVFRHVTEADIEDGVRRVLSIDEAKIRAAVEEFGPLDRGERDKMLKTLLARRQDLAKRYPSAVPKAPLPVPAARVTVAEQRAIEASRANGLTLNTDSGDIEDHHVVVSTLTDASGKPVTRVALKLRKDAGEKLQKGMTTDGGVPTIVELQGIKDKATQFLKGVGALAKNGEVLRPKDFERAASLLAELNKADATIWESGKLLADAEAGLRVSQKLNQLKEMLTKWQAVNAPGQKAVAFEHFVVDQIPGNLAGKPIAASSGGITWQTSARFDYANATFADGKMTEVHSTSRLSGVSEAREVTVNGARVRYIPYNKGNSITSEGYMQIDLPGVDAETTAKAFGVLKDLGVPTHRATATDRLELYLERIANVRTLRNKPLAGKLDSIRTISNQEERTAAMLEALNKDAGFDMRTHPNWNPDGNLQAFGHGRTVMMRPDLPVEEIASFEKDYTLYHNPTGLSIGGDRIWERVQQILDAGGQFASQMDRVRRGVIPTGSSVESDHRTGGASYVFTRILPRSREKAAGLYWKPRQALRADAFSYDGDKFGEVTRSLQEGHRAKDIDGMKRNARTGSNETNFRDSLSMFDDLERIVVNTRRDYDEALKWLRSKGYKTWPDGRKLEDVFDYIGSKK